jgi:hypothetical protein
MPVTTVSSVMPSPSAANAPVTGPSSSSGNMRSNCPRFAAAAGSCFFAASISGFGST